MAPKIVVTFGLEPYFGDVDHGLFGAAFLCDWGEASSGTWDAPGGVYWDGFAGGCFVDSGSG